MSALTDKLSKPYPNNSTIHRDLPDEAPIEHPVPWSIRGKDDWGRDLIYDANGTLIIKLHLLKYVRADVQEFVDKMNRINRTQQFLFSDYFNDIGGG